MKKGKSHFRLLSDGQPVIQALKAGPLLSSLPVRTGKYRHAPAVLAAGSRQAPLLLSKDLSSMSGRPDRYLTCLPDKSGPLLPAKLALWSPAEPAPEGPARQRLWRLLSRLFGFLQDQTSGNCSYGPFNACRACFYPQDSACICPRSGFITGRPVLL